MIRLLKHSSHKLLKSQALCCGLWLLAIGNWPCCWLFPSWPLFSLPAYQIICTHTHTPQAFAVASFANRPVDKLRSYGINQLVLAGAFPIPIPLQNSSASAGQLQFISPAPQWEFERKAVPARSSCERVSITKLTEIATYCVVVVVMLLNGHVWWEGRRHPEWAGRCGPAIKLHRKMSSTWRPTTVSN